MVNWGGEMGLAASGPGFRLRTGRCFGGGVVSLPCGVIGGGFGGEGYKGQWLDSYTASGLLYDEPAPGRVSVPNVPSVIWNRSLVDMLDQ
jgi:hypothetical protein